MAFAQNSRDVRIRITGENLLGGPVRDARRELDILKGSIDGLVGGKAGKFFGAAATGGAAGLIAGTAANTFAPALTSQIQTSLKKALDFSEPLARAFGIVTDHAKELATQMQTLSKSVRDATGKVTQQALSPSAKASEALFGNLLPEGGVLSLLGNRQGKFGAALGDIDKQRAELNRQRGAGLPASFRQKAMEQELANIEAGRGVTERVSRLGGHFLSMMGVPNLLEEQDQSDINLARARVSQRAVRELGGRNRSFSRAQGELDKREQQLRAIFGIEQGARNFATGAGNVASLFGGAFGTAGRSLFGGLASGASGLTEAMRLNREGRLATETPAERLRRELGNLDRDRSRGLSGDVFQRRRGQLLRQAISGLDREPATPDLAALESRFRTRGADRDPVDKNLSEMRRELKEYNRKQQEDMKKLIAATQKKAATEVTIE